MTCSLKEVRICSIVIDQSTKCLCSLFVVEWLWPLIKEVVMDIKVAVASSNGKTINEHFGKAKSFTIYRLVDDKWQYVEDRPTLPACNGQGHSDQLLDQMASLLSDCQGIIVNQIGPGAMDTLLYRNILPFALSGSIEEALTTVLQSKLFRIRYKLK